VGELHANRIRQLRDAKNSFDPAVLHREEDRLRNHIPVCRPPVIWSPRRLCLAGHAV